MNYFLEIRYKDIKLNNYVLSQNYFALTMLVVIRYLL